MFLHSFCKSEKISHIGLQYSCSSFGIDWKPLIWIVLLSSSSKYPSIQSQTASQFFRSKLEIQNFFGCVHRDHPDIYSRKNQQQWDHPLPARVHNHPYFHTSLHGFRKKENHRTKTVRWFWQGHKDLNWLIFMLSPVKLCIYLIFHVFSELLYAIFCP